MSVAESALRNVMDEIIGENYKNNEIKFKPLTSGGANYTSSLFSVTLSAKNEDELKLFAKVANINGELRRLMNVRCLFETEQFVYTILAETYERIQDKYDISRENRFTFPKYYGGTDTDGEETVVLEDLVSRGYTPYSRFKSVDWDHVASAITVLARLHALSFGFAKDDPDNYAKALEKVKLKIYDNPDDRGVKETWMKMMRAAVKVTREEHKDKVTKFLYRDVPTEEVYKFRMPLSTPVLCHGDFRISNLMFKEQNGSIETIVVDYQTVHSGCPAIDLLYLEFMGTDEEFRRENHDRLVNKYFEELTLSLDRLSLDVNEVYPRETFDSELREMLPSALLATAFVLPLVLVEVDRAPQLGNAGIEDFAISPNQQFAERFSGIVSDCVRWGAL